MVNHVAMDATAVYCSKNFVLTEASVETTRKRQIPVAFCMAGGYIGSNLSHVDLVSIHRITIQRFRLDTA